MVRYVEEYIKSCPQCQMPRVSRRPTASFLQPLPVHWPMGLFPKSYEGNVYVAVLSDALTKFSVAAPLKDATAASVADFYVNEIILKFGTPHVLLTDRRSHSRNQLFYALNEICGVIQLSRFARRHTTQKVTALWSAVCRL